jgi:NADH-dependent peroxiredoxin subunit F
MEFSLNLPLESNLAAGEEKDVLFDLAILGGGPAGLTAGVYASRKLMRTVLISPDLGGQVLATSGVENYMGYQYVTGPELSKKFSEQIRQFPLKLIANEKSAAVSQRADGMFVVRTPSSREVVAQTLVLATGKRWRELGVPGEAEHVGRGVAYCAICDAPFFKGLPVAVAGGGNSAVSAALDLLKLGCAVTLINSADGWQADPVLLDQVRERTTLLDAHKILEVEGDGVQVKGLRLVPRNGGEEKHLAVRGVFVEIGLIPNTEIFRGFVTLNAKNEVQVDCSSATSRSGVYAAGDCTSVPEKQIIIAAGEGAKAALAAHRYLMYSKRGK